VIDCRRRPRLPGLIDRFGCARGEAVDLECRGGKIGQGDCIHPGDLARGLPGRFPRHFLCPHQCAERFFQPPPRLFGPAQAHVGLAGGLLRLRHRQGETTIRHRHFQQGRCPAVTASIDIGTGLVAEAGPGGDQLAGTLSGTLRFGFVAVALEVGKQLGAPRAYSPATEDS